MSEADREILGAFRLSFTSAYQETFTLLHSRFGLQPTGRHPKTVASIVAKLRRQPTTRLSQMQDIAGCRIVIPGIETQDAVVSQIVELFSEVKVDDRRAKPSHGYRAVHLIAKAATKPVEIQVRTALQDGWAEVTEKLADRFGLDIKYGGGPREIREVLDDLSSIVAELETRRMKRTEAIAEQSDVLRTWKVALRRSWWRHPRTLAVSRWRIWRLGRHIQTVADQAQGVEARTVNVFERLREFATRPNQEEAR
jgi:ppGpp synthetase/RelA/SpoT-type nucleotidyltranferase